MVDGSLSVLNETVQSDVDLGSLKRYPVRKLFATRWDPAGILTASLWDPHKDLTWRVTKSGFQSHITLNFSTKSRITEIFFNQSHVT